MARGDRFLRRSVLFGVAAAVALLFAATGPAAAEAAGDVTRIQERASATTAGETRPLSVGSVVNLNDILETGPGARLEITLRDDTKLVVGANGRLILDRFVYSPDTSTREMLVRVVTGAFRFASGKLRRFARDEIAVRTPVATIGIRGTDFWGGEIDAAYGVFLFEGRIVVSSFGGEAVLDRPGTGVSVADAAAVPGPVIVWPQDKLARAVATVAFR